MVFGFGKKKPIAKRNDEGDESDDDDGDDDGDLVNFQGAMNGKSVDLVAQGKLVQVALLPAKRWISSGLERRAEMIRLDVKGEKAHTTLSIDGMPYGGSRMPRQQASYIIQMMKFLAGLDAKIKGRHQAGGIKSEYLGAKFELSVEVIPHAEGTERLTIRVRNLKQKLDTPAELGFTESLRQSIRDLTAHRRGLIVVCGPPGSGTTTTVYGLLRGIVVYLYSIYSIVNTWSRELLNVKTFEANDGDNYETSCLRMMREEADVIFVPPLKDAETTQQFMSVADRICIVSEMTAKDSAHAIAQLVALSGNSKLASEVIDAVFSQKLVRLLCPECREAFRPSPKLLSKVALPPETKVLYRKPVPVVDEKTGEEEPPCEKCSGTGFFGRVAMLEAILVSDAMRVLIAMNATAAQIKELSRSEGGLTFHKDGLRLVAEGKTSLEELQRVFRV